MLQYGEVRYRVWDPEKKCMRFIANSETIMRAYDRDKKGNVIFDFGVPGRTGSCKRCGKCCGECQYLIMRPGEQAVCDIRMNIFNIAKGCTLSPSKINDIENYPDCGFKFDMED